MSFTIKGCVHEVGHVQQITDTFKKRELVLEYADNPQFVEYPTFQLLQDRVNLLDSLRLGDEVEVTFNISGRPWTNKEGITTFFNSLNIWKITAVKSNQGLAMQPNTNFYTPMPVDISGDQDDYGDLPF